MLITSHKHYDFNVAKFEFHSQWTCTLRMFILYSLIIVNLSLAKISNLEPLNCLAWYTVNILDQYMNKYRTETSVFINWSGLYPYFARLWLAETAFTRVYFRVRGPQTAFRSVFRVSIISYARLTSVGVKKSSNYVNLCEGKLPII